MTRTQVLPREPTAVISVCGTYRYLLTRPVGPGSRVATFLMLNPSTADATNDDPTIRRCIGFARRWGCGRLVVLNLFAVRATHPADMKGVDDPVGLENKAWFDRTFQAHHDGPVVCAWGVHGAHMRQDLTVLGWLESHHIQPLAFGITRDGHPKHPLYLPSTAELIPFRRRATSVTSDAWPLFRSAEPASVSSLSDPRKNQWPMAVTVVDDAGHLVAFHQDGKVIGGIDVSGVKATEDGQIARAGLAALEGSKP